MSLSTDGGATFTPFGPTTNDGSLDIVVPNDLTIDGRILIEAASECFFNVTGAFEIVDTLPPTIDMPADVAVTTCSEDADVMLTAPTATDSCSTATVEGVIVESNGQVVNIPVADGSVILPTGVHTVEWTATDDAGNIATTTNLVTVNPGIVAFESLRLADHANTDAALASYGTTELGVMAESASIVSMGDVFLRNDALVTGDLTTTSDLETQAGASVTGITETSATVLSLPPADTSVPIVAAASGSRVVDAGDTVTLSPGSYGRVIVNSHGTLILDNGAYDMRSLIVNSDSTLEHGATDIGVEDGFIFRGHQVSTGDLSIRMTGTRTLHLETSLDANIVAPHTDVILAGDGMAVYTGQLRVGSLLLEANVELDCVD